MTGLTVALVTIGALAGPAAATSNGPVYGGDFPDPSVTVAGGRYYAFGTGHASNLHRDSSAGPFICQRSLGGSIDPQPFLAPDGSPSLYLLWKSDNIAIGQPTALWAEQLTSNGRSMVGRRSRFWT